MKNINLLIILLGIAVLLLSSCEDEPPTEYTPYNYIEAILLVDEPVTGLRIIETQPIDIKYSYENAAIKDAVVKLKSGGETIDLVYADGENPGYMDPDSHIVQPNSVYDLEVTFPDGSKAAGRTYTPGRFDWIIKPKDILYFPKDTINLPGADSLKISWEEASFLGIYLLSVKCLDTLEYGKYLEPPTNEMNRRTFSLFNDNDSEYYEIKNWVMMANTETPTVWMAFKWFGKQQIELYAPDYNYYRWFMQANNMQGSTEYVPLLTSVEGAIGVFGSASVIRYESFLVKNQP